MTFITLPVVTAIEPSAAPFAASTVVTIAATNFGNDTATLTVTIGGVVCRNPMIVVTPPALVCTAPPGRGSSHAVLVSREVLGTSLTSVANPATFSYLEVAPVALFCSFAGSGERLQCGFDSRIAQIPDMQTCSSFISQETVRLLGAATRCIWADESTLSILLGHSQHLARPLSANPGRRHRFVFPRRSPQS